MPQLGPLNWLFLFVLFWSFIVMMTCLIWWMNPQNYYFSVGRNNLKSKHFWLW
uniref:ATP synthase F0 subunit 8 n=1 Tax=Ennucula tenuis TaxID=106224 RepID=UPI00286B62D7|nr:ATP synthase F0 subunit 8 [Ennucula tenuis]WLV28181.1 ATP synthase F0 subunit 8 [Ennucula tenuis]